MFNVLFFVNSILFGVGLAIDAFSVSVADALNEPGMKLPRMSAIAGTFGFFQILMPMVGWVCVHTIAEAFGFFEKLIPWIALVLLLFLGIKMIVEALKKAKENDDPDGTKPVRIGLTFPALIIQGIATSIDALSVGFTISGYTWNMALIESLIIGVVTYGICMAGLLFGKGLGKTFRGRAGLIGGIILIAIGLEIFLTGIF